MTQSHEVSQQVSRMQDSLSDVRLSHQQCTSHAQDQLEATVVSQNIENQQLASKLEKCQE